jgi:hypothetical protein
LAIKAKKLRPHFRAVEMTANLAGSSCCQIMLQGNFQRNRELRERAHEKTGMWFGKDERRKNF